MSEWMPIETAPKDGTWVLLCGGELYEDEWEENTLPLCVVAQYEKHDYGDGYWVFARYDSAVCTCTYEKPKHWMPLPPPPATK